MLTIISFAIHRHANPLSRGTGAVGLSLVVWLETFLYIHTLTSELLILQYCIFCPVPPVLSICMFGCWQKFVCISELSFSLCCISNSVCIKLLSISSHPSMHPKFKQVGVKSSFQQNYCIVKYMFTSDNARRDTNTLACQYDQSSMSLWCLEVHAKYYCGCQECGNMKNATEVAQYKQNFGVQLISILPPALNLFVSF